MGVIAAPLCPRPCTKSLLAPSLVRTELSISPFHSSQMSLMYLTMLRNKVRDPCKLIGLKTHTPGLCPVLAFRKIDSRGMVKIFKIYGYWKIWCEREGLTLFYLPSITKYIHTIVIKFVKTRKRYIYNFITLLGGRGRVIYDFPPVVLKDERWDADPEYESYWPKDK